MVCVIYYVIIFYRKLIDSFNAALTSANNENKSFLKTWQLALAIGIPSAIVIGYFIYKRRGQSNKQKTINEAKKDEKTTSTTSSVTSVERKEELPSKV
jgi:H+/gluconate symporter-like permease